MQAEVHTLRGEIDDNKTIAIAADEALQEWQSHATHLHTQNQALAEQVRAQSLLLGTARAAASAMKEEAHVVPPHPSPIPPQPASQPLPQIVEELAARLSSTEEQLLRARELLAAQLSDQAVAARSEHLKSLNKKAEDHFQQVGSLLAKLDNDHTAEQEHANRASIFQDEIGTLHAKLETVMGEHQSELETTRLLRAAQTETQQELAAVQQQLTVADAEAHKTKLVADEALKLNDESTGQLKQSKIRVAGLLSRVTDYESENAMLKVQTQADAASAMSARQQLDELAADLEDKSCQIITLAEGASKAVALEEETTRLRYLLGAEEVKVHELKKQHSQERGRRLDVEALLEDRDGAAPRHANPKATAAAIGGGSGAVAKRRGAKRQRPPPKSTSSSSLSSSSTSGAVGGSAPSPGGFGGSGFGLHSKSDLPTFPSSRN
jgi:hypothetical protein